MASAEELMAAVRRFEASLEGVVEPAPPRRPGREACKHFLRWQRCAFPGCRFDHPKGERPDARIEQEIAANVPELSLIIGAAQRIREGCENLDKVKKRAANEVGIKSLATVSIVNLIEMIHSVLPLRDEIVQTSMAPDYTVHGYQLFFYYDLLPNLFRAANGIVNVNTLEEYRRITSRFVEKENALIQGVRNCTSPLLDAIDADLFRYSNEQTVAMIAKASTYSAVRLELVAAIESKFQAGNFQVKLDAFGSVASTLGSPKSDLDLSISISKLPSDGAPTSQAGTVAALLEEGKVLQAVLECLHLEAPPGDDEEDVDVDDEDDDEEGEGEGEDEGDDEVGNEEQRAAEGKSPSRRKSGPSPAGVVSGFTVREFVATARVPVLKLHHTATGTDIDVINCNVNGLANTQLLRQYAYYDPRVRPLILAVKRWSSSRGTNQSQNSTLSSYAWVLLVIFFCQSRPVPIVPNLQLNGAFAYQAGATNLVPLPPPADPTPTKGVGQLLLEFFVFYASFADGSFNCHDYVASVRYANKFEKPHVRGGKMNKRKQHEKRRAVGAATSGDDDGGDAERDQLGAEALAQHIESLSLSTETVFPSASHAMAGQVRRPITSEDGPWLSTVTNSSVPWKLSVEDPIETTHDLGSVIHNPLGQLHISSELRRGLGLFLRYLAGKPLGPGAAPDASLFEALCEPCEHVPFVPFSLTCRLCQTEGHTTKACPMYQCRRCGKQGHIAKRCPEPAGTKRSKGGGKRGGRGAAIERAAERAAATLAINTAAMAAREVRMAAEAEARALRFSVLDTRSWEGRGGGGRGRGRGRGGGGGGGGGGGRGGEGGGRGRGGGRGGGGAAGGGGGGQGV